MSEIINRLDKFTPYKLLLDRGFDIGDERNEDGSKTWFANVPKNNGKGSMDLNVFGPMHEPFPECIHAIKEIERLKRALDWSLDDPKMDDFIEAVKSEMQHQRKRWGKEHDHDKQPFDWIALAVRLQGKMVEAIWDKDKDKFLHHVITLAAVMGNCHAAQISKRD